MVSGRALKAWAAAVGAAVAMAGGAEATAPDLLQDLPKARVSLGEGVRLAARPPAVAISAKYELDGQGNLSLSVYTAGKGLGADAEHNLLQQWSGSPEVAAWKPEAETFKDPEHLARAAEQVTLWRLAHATLAEILARVGSHGGFVFSVTPEVRGGKAELVVLVAREGRVLESIFDLATGAEHGAAHPLAAGK